MNPGEPFPGLIIPFGCLIEYKPRAEKEVEQVLKFNKRTLPGVFMGYHARHGGRWFGDYSVIDAAAYGSATDKRGVYVHRVKEIIKPDRISFPIKDGSIKQSEHHYHLAKEQAEQKVPIGDPTEDTGIEPTVHDLPTETAEGDLTRSGTSSDK